MLTTQRRKLSEAVNAYAEALSQALRQGRQLSQDAGSPTAGRARRGRPLVAAARCSPAPAPRSGPAPSAGGAGRLSRRPRRQSAAGAGAATADQTVPFYGAHQAGIATPAQDRLAFGALNVVAGTTRADLRDLLRTWTDAAAAMTAGPAGRRGQRRRRAAGRHRRGGRLAGVPADHHARLRPVAVRRPLRPRRPKARRAAALPPLPNENLDPDYTGGDLCIQACSDDPLVAFHAVRNLARLGMGVVEHNWMELGFGRTSTTSDRPGHAAQPARASRTAPATSRPSRPTSMDRYVWVGAETDQPWMRGGSYLVARRIRMFIENWDRDYLADQQHVFGRAKVSGAPLTGGTEFTTPDFTATSDRPARDPGRRAHPAGQPRAERRTRDPAPRLLLHRRHRPGRPARCSAACSSSRS